MWVGVVIESESDKCCRIFCPAMKSNCVKVFLCKMSPWLGVTVVIFSYVTHTDTHSHMLINLHHCVPFLQRGDGVEELLDYVVFWVGISVALVCLATCLTTLCCQGAPWHTDHSTIHLNLWANLLITELLFLVGANKTQYTVSAYIWHWSNRRQSNSFVRHGGSHCQSHGVVNVVSCSSFPLKLILWFKFALCSSALAGCVFHHCWPAALFAALCVLLVVSGGCGAVPAPKGGI